MIGGGRRGRSPFADSLASSAVSGARVRGDDDDLADDDADPHGYREQDDDDEQAEHQRQKGHIELDVERQRRSVAPEDHEPDTDREQRADQPRRASVDELPLEPIAQERPDDADDGGCREIGCTVAAGRRRVGGLTLVES